MCLFIFLLFSVNTLCFITLTVCTFLNTTIFFINELNVLHYFKMIVFVYFTFNKAILVDCFIH